MPSELVSTLVGNSELVEIGTFSLSATRSLHLPAVSDEMPEQVQVQPNYVLSTMAAPAEGRFLIRLAMNVELPVGFVSCDVGAEYQISKSLDIDLDNRLLVDFANEVGIAVLLPFIRQAVADLSQRVFGSPLLMPIMAPGALHFSSN